MKIDTVRTEGLGNSTYILAHDGLGIIVDPQRDIDRFTSVVERLGVETRWVFETHLHNDYVSGASDLARLLNAELVVPAGAAPSYRHRPAFHGELLTVDGLSIRPLHTPGHTPEHVSYVVVIDGAEQAVFSGGSLLVGSSGRSDLLGTERADSLARLQYQSINRLAQLPDSAGLYPTHGAGSFCTASRATRDTSTIGDERRSNPGLQHENVDSFVLEHLSGLLPYPSYYRHMGPANLKGLPPADLTPPPPLDEYGFKEVDVDVIIDGRPKADFASGHLPGSLGLELRDDFGVWAGWVTPFNPRIALVLDPDQPVQEAQRQLARIGYDRIIGLITDLDQWDAKLSSHPVHDVGSFVARLDDEEVQVLDVRAPDEWQSGVIDGSLHEYAPHLATAVPAALDRSRPVLVGCETGYRASLAASILQKEGYLPEVLVGAGIPEVLAVI